MERHPEYCYDIETTVFADYHLHRYPQDKARMKRLPRPRGVWAGKWVNQKPAEIMVSLSNHERVRMISASAVGR
jgi:hypothetical protein